MRIGMFTAAQWSPEETPGAFLTALREQVRAARANGFSSLFVGQHLLTGPMGMFQTNPLLGYLVDDAAGMQIGPGVLLLSMMNPVLAAEEAATLDWLSDGNYVLGAGLGYRPEEFQAMGVDQRERVGRLTEGLELIKRLWTEDSVTHHGRYFQLDDARVSVRPKRTPRPPIWLRGDVEAAVRRAARIADAWCIAPTLSIRSIEARLEVFRAERRKIGAPEDVSCPLIRECFVGRDALHAATASRAPLVYKYRAYAARSRPPGTTSLPRSMTSLLGWSRRELNRSRNLVQPGGGSESPLQLVQWPCTSGPRPGPGRRVWQEWKP
jgi:alkanesulfonate monooxygenase SsuD/methylene tetrahydromethanopterin reductase-like flavin-dependent oxidoreductase (luciferase family)